MLFYEAVLVLQPFTFLYFADMNVDEKYFLPRKV